NGGFETGGINFDAKIRRNSTDLKDLFYAHIGGMDVMARALLTAHQILTESSYKELRRERYASFDEQEGAAFESGELGLEDLETLAKEKGSPEKLSGSQEYYEYLINQDIESIAIHLRQDVEVYQTLCMVTLFLYSIK